MKARGAFRSLGMLAAAAAMAGAAHAGTFSAGLGEFNGSGANITESWGTMVFAIAPGEIADSATLSGMFGNSVTSSTSVHAVYADGIEVARCASESDFCWTTGPEAWSYTFTGSELSIFNDGAVEITTTQFACCVVREGELSLRGTTVPVPEPGTYALMALGLAGVAVAARRRRS